jgi:hypothetical protein
LFFLGGVREFDAVAAGDPQQPGDPSGIRLDAVVVPGGLRLLERRAGLGELPAQLLVEHLGHNRPFPVRGRTLCRRNSMYGIEEFFNYTVLYVVDSDTRDLS